MFASIVLVVMISSAWAQTDSLYLHLDSLTFVSETHTLMIKEEQGDKLSVDISMMQNLPKIMGNTDPISFLRMLPGVQTCSEYDSGLHIQGSDISHNDISVAGVPVFGASHLFGLFSVFNPAHYSMMSFHKKSPDRIGAMIVMEHPDTISSGYEGTIDVGIMSSQASLAARLGKKFQIRASVRQSYLNLLYKKWLYLDNSPITYDFGDYNLTCIYDADSHDKVWFDAYFGRDKAFVASQQFAVDLSDRWGNLMGAIHWEHVGDMVRHKHSAYFSGYSCHAGIRQFDSSVDLSSSIMATGYKSSVEWKNLAGGMDFSFYDACPQHPVLKGLFNTTETVRERQQAVEINLRGNYSKTFKDNWTLDGGLRASLYLNPEKKWNWGLDPHVSITYNAYSFGKVKASYGMQRQFLFYTGFSNIGVPVDFWFLAGKHSRPQSSQYADLSYEVSLGHGRFAFSMDLYFKRLYNQVEFRGDIFDLFNSKYDLDHSLLKGDGYNYGVNLQFMKQTGNLTGWIGYSLGRALRKFDNPGYDGLYPSGHERIHELNVVGMYKFRKWNFSGTFVYASGSPFTPLEYCYVSSGQVISSFADYNSHRMRPYARLDLSVTVKFISTERQENGLNLSIYNVLGRKNDVMYRLHVFENELVYRRMAFMLRFLPSISYYHKF